MYTSIAPDRKIPRRGCAPNFAPTRTTPAGLGARPRARGRWRCRVRTTTCVSVAHMSRRRRCRGGAETRSALLRDPDSQLQAGHGTAGGLGPGLGARRLLGGGLHRRRAARLLGEFKTLPEPIVASITGQGIVQQAIERITLLDSLGHDVRCASNIIPGFLATLIRNRGQVQVFLVNRFVEVTHRVTSPP